MFEQYERALRGVAISPEGSRVAVGTDQGEAFSPRGLRLYDLTRPQPIAALSVVDGGFSGTVLAFSPDGGLLYTLEGAEIAARDGQTLQVIRRVDAPPGAFVAVAPSGALLFADEAKHATVWLEPSSGATLRTVPFVVVTPTWTADGTMGASAGETARSSTCGASRTGSRSAIRLGGRRGGD